MIILVMLILLAGLTIIKDEMLRQSSADVSFFNQTKDNKSEKMTNISTKPVCTNCNSVNLSRFSIEITKIVQDSMLSRIVTAKIRAKEDVRDLTAHIQLYVGSERIKVNDMDEIEVYIGNMKAGDEVEKEIRISIDVFSAMKVRQNGQVDLLLTLSFDGGQEEIKIPVKVG